MADGAVMELTSTRQDVLDVLLIDDDPELAELVDSVLRYHTDQRFSVRVETTARHGMAEYDRRPADVVILDLGLPDTSRADPLATLKSLLARNPTPCVVVLTGHPWPGLGRQALRMGAQDYLEKGDLSASRLRDGVLYAVERHAHTVRNVPSSALAGAEQVSRAQGQPGGAERLRTPLSTLTNAIEEAHGRRVADPDLAELLERALRGAYALGGQLDQVVAAQRRTVDREPVELEAIALDVADGLAGLTDAVGGSIIVGDLPAVWGQPDPLRLLLRNLLVNALQHGGPGVHVEVGHEDRPRGLQIRVDDTGPGIEPEDRSGVFDAEAQHGRGFGLRACAAVATAHGGRCWIEDSHLGGTRVVVELPVRRRAS